MLPELEALLTLQRHDIRLQEARRRLGELPGRRASLETAVAGARAARDQAKKDLEQVRLERRALEKEVEAFQAEALKLERQLLDVKTNQEYQAMLHQIAATKGKRSDVETKILESYDREEQAQKAHKDSEQRVAAEEAKQRQGQEALAKEHADLEQDIHSITHDRDAVKPAIPVALLARYDRVAKLRDGVGVAEIRKGACGACFRGLTPHALQEARRSDSVQACESCGRILVWTEASAA